MKILAIGDLHGHINKKLKERISKEDFDFVIGVGDYAGIDDWYPWLRHTFKTKDVKKWIPPQEFFGKKKFRKLLKKDFEAGKKSLLFLDNLGMSGFFVFGNADDEWYNYPFSKKILQAKKSKINFLKKIKNIKEMTYAVKNYRGVSLLGFGGYMDATANESHRDKEWQMRVNIRHNKSKKKMESLVKKLKRKPIFILHYPPLGIFDKILDKKNPFYGGSTGVDFFRKEIIKRKPFLVLCGHMHEYVGKKKLGSSLVVNPGQGSKGEFAIIDVNEKKRKVRKIKFIR